MALLSLISITKEQILEWINTGSLIAFVAVLALVLILFLRGLLRGWKAGTYHFLAMALVFIVPMFFLGMIADAVGGINLGQWIHDPIIITVGPRTVSVPVTTVFETSYNVVYVLLHDVMKLSASASSTANYAIALTGSLIRLFIVFIWGLLTLLIMGPFLTLLWHIGFKHIIPKPRRKPKLRLVSAFEEAIAFMGIAIVGIAPLSGLFSAIRNNAVIPDSKNETVMLVRDVINTYNNSIFNQAFFAWTKGSGTDTLDTKIAEFFAQNSYKVDEATYNANAIKEVRVLSGVEGSISNTLIASEPNKALVSSVIHSSLLIGQSLYTMAQGDNELLDTLVPLAYDVARNSDFLMDEYEGKALFDGFAASKKARMQAFDGLAASNYVSTVEGISANTYFTPVYDGLSSFSSKTLDRIEAKLDADSSAHEFVNAILSGYVYQDFLNNEDSIYEELLPLNADGKLDEERFEEIDWFKEAKIFRRCREDLSALPKLANATSDDDIAADFIARAAKNMTAIIDSLVGKRDANRKPITNDAGESQEGVCLLDSDLISNFLPVVLQFGAYFFDDSVLVDAEDPTDFLDRTAAIAEKLVGDRSNPANAKINFKNEFGAILDIVGDIASHEAGQTFLADYKNHPGLEFAKDGTLIDFSPAIAEAFMSGIANLDRSELLTYAAPIAGDHFARPMLKDDGVLGKMNISKLDFHCEKLGSRVADLLSIGKYCSDVLASFGGLFKTDGDAKLDPNNFFLAMTSLETEAKNYQVTHLLDILTDSPILNPVYVDATSSTTNRNITSLLQYFLSGIDPDTEFKLDADALDGMVLAGEWDGATLRKKGDNFFTAQVFKQIAETGVIDEFASLSESSSTKAIQTLSTIGIDTLFENIGLSKVLSKLLPPFFDTNLLGTLLNSDNALQLDEIGVTYKNLLAPADWAAEGRAMQAILNLAANGLDLSALDVFDPAIMDLMHELASSRIFVMPDGEYVFGTYFTDKLLSALTDVEQFKLFTDYPDKAVPAFGNKTVKTVIEEKGADYWKGKDAKVIEDKKALASVFVRSMQLPQDQEGWGHELENLRAVVSCVAGLGGIDGMTDFNSENLPSVVIALKALGDTDSLSSVLPGNLFNKAFASGKVSGAISAENVNLGWLYRNAEEFVTAMEENGYNREAAPVAEKLGARNAEMEYMTALIKLAATNDSIKTGEMNFANLDVDAFVRPLFYASRSSKVLNPTSVDDLYSPTLAMPEFTVFEDIILRFVKNSGVYAYVDGAGNPVSDYTPENYDTVYVKGTKRTLKSIIKSISASSGWTEETDALCNLVETIQGSSFIKDGQLSFDVFSSKEGLTEFFAKDGSQEELIDLMGALQESELFYRCLPSKLERAINDALEKVNFGHISEDIACADFYLYQDPLHVDFPRYSHTGKFNTVDGLVEIFAALSAMTGLDMSDFSTVDIDALSTALTAMSTSPVFNANTTKSNLVFSSLAPERKGMTSFQALFCDILDVKSLNDYLFYAASPKDIAHVAAGDYSDAPTKAAYTIKSLFPVLNGTNAELIDDLADKYIADELAYCFQGFKEDRFAGFVSGSMSFADLDEDSFLTLLTSLNDCTILRDCVPNAAHKTLILDGTIDVSGVALTSADIFFSYYYHDGEGHFSSTRRSDPDFSMPFYGPEIDQIASIFAILNDPYTKSIMSNMKMKDLDPVLVRNILLDLYDSYIFHEAAKENRDTTSPVLVNPDDPSIIDNFPELTVFEQFIYKIFLKAGLLQINYSAPKFYDYSFDADGAFRGDAGAYYKGFGEIRAYTDSTYGWLSEIDALTSDGLHHEGLVADVKDPIVGIIAAAQDAGMFSDDNNGVAVDYNSTKKMSPDKIRGLLYAINACRLLDDALPLSMNSLLGTATVGGSSGGIGLNKYSVHTYTYPVAGGAKTIDMNDVAALFTDGDTSSLSSFHAVNEIVLPVTGGIGDADHPQFTVTFAKGTPQELDMTPLFTPSEYDSGTGTVTLATADKIWVPVEITLTGSASFTAGSVGFPVDFANFDIGAKAYSKTGLDAIGYLLSSAYRGENFENRYFSFNDYADGTLASFFDEKENHKSDFDHSTYGLLALFADSGFYDIQLDENNDFVSATPNHDGAAYSLYSALRFKVSAKVDVQIDTPLGPIDLPTIDELSLGELIGKGTTEGEHLKALDGILNRMVLTDMAYVTKEAYWFDHFAASAGTYTAYDEALKSAMDSGYTDEIIYILLTGVDKAFSVSPNDAVGEIIKSLSSTTYDYAIDVPLSDSHPEHYEGVGLSPDIGRSVLANLITSNATIKGQGLALTYAPYSPSTGYSTKDTRIDSILFTDDLFDLDYQLMDFSYLEEVGADFRLMKLFHLHPTEAFTTLERVTVSASFTVLSDTDVAANFNRIFYLSSLYDQLVYNPLSQVNGVFTATTDLPSFLTDGVIDSVPTPLTFHAIAQLYA